MRSDRYYTSQVTLPFASRTRLTGGYYFWKVECSAKLPKISGRQWRRLAGESCSHWLMWHFANSVTKFFMPYSHRDIPYSLASVDACSLVHWLCLMRSRCWRPSFPPSGARYFERACMDPKAGPPKNQHRPSFPGLPGRWPPTCRSA